jgi:hypothetical protein
VRLLLSLVLAGLSLTGPAAAQIQPGAVAPDFTKTELGGGPRSLSEFSGKVVILFLFGHG